MEKLKLTLTDSDGVVIATWNIGNELEVDFNVEDLSKEPKYDFYIDHTWNDMDSIGEAVWQEAENHFKSQRRKKT